VETSVGNWVWRGGVGGDRAPIVAGKTAYRPPGPVGMRERQNSPSLAFVNVLTLFSLEIFVITFMPSTAIERLGKD